MTAESSSQREQAGLDTPGKKSMSLEFLFTTDAIRHQANRIYQLSKEGKTHFFIDENRLQDVVNYVFSVITENYPSLEVPYHSRWRHFEVGNQYQLNAFQKATANLSTIEKAKISLDLIIPSVLVDAGAGSKWLYRSDNSETIGRSEGLALASIDALLAGAFGGSSLPMGTHANGLKDLKQETFQRLFKSSVENPLLAVEGRYELLQRLAVVLSSKPNFFPNQRPGDLVDYLASRYGYRVQGHQILSVIFQSLGSLWPGRLSYEGVNLGDTWQYSPFGEGLDSFVPFHKLSQWLTYSVIETLEQNGFVVTGLEKLTGLAEYRNGGLLIDLGLLVLRNPENAQQSWHPSSELIIEWRAITLIMLDKIAAQVQQKLNKSADVFPLAKVLEGGTWSAGRKIAKAKRSDGNSPISIISDGTVF